MGFCFLVKQTRARMPIGAPEEKLVSGRPTRIALSIRAGWRQSLSIPVGRLESLCRFTSADLIRCVESRRPTCIVASILAGRLESLRRFGAAVANAVDSGRPIRIAVSIHVGRLESMRRFTSTDLNRCADSRRTTRITASIPVGCRQSLAIRGGRRESMRRFTSADLNRWVASRRPT